MKKLFSLIKAIMTEDMSLFRIKSKNENSRTKTLLPIILYGIMLFLFFSYANMIMAPLHELHMEYAGLTMFILLTAFLSLIQGVYKSSGLLFNCKDDDLLFSLPLKKSTILFLRIFKFYTFELLYNTMFLLPAMVAYAIYVKVGVSYYLISILALLLLPVIPIAISSIIGMIISFISSRFKKQNMVQTVISMIFLLGIMYMSFNSENLVEKLTQNAESISDMITKLYLPAGLYINLILNYQIKDLLIFIVLNIFVLAFVTIAFSRIYFNINSRVKSIKTGKINKNYQVKTNKPIKALVTKELNRFKNSPVFVTNAAFALVLFIVGCIAIVLKYDSIANSINSEIGISFDTIRLYVPLALFAFIMLSSFMTSITSSMISLEGKSFNILKSLPVEAHVILNAKVLTALVIMIPILLIGDLIVIIKFGFNIIQILLLIIASIIFPLVSETIGIIVNLLFPKMDAQNDTEVVKQSTSSMVAVLIGMFLLIITMVGIIILGLINIYLSMITILIIYSLIYLGLYYYLKKIGPKKFNEICV